MIKESYRGWPCLYGENLARGPTAVRHWWRHKVLAWFRLRSVSSAGRILSRLCSCEDWIYAVLFFFVANDFWSTRPRPKPKPNPTPIPKWTEKINPNLKYTTPSPSPPKITGLVRKFKKFEMLAWHESVCQADGGDLNICTFQASGWSNQYKTGYCEGGSTACKTRYLLYPASPKKVGGSGEVWLKNPRKSWVELSCVNLVQTIPRELDKLHWIGEGMLTKLDIIFKGLSILKCFARPGTVGGHFRNIRKWRPPSILVFCPFSRLTNWHKLRKVYWIWQVATARSINHSVGALKELSCRM